MISKVYKEVQSYLQRQHDGQDRRGQDRCRLWWLGLFGLIVGSLVVVICPALAADPALFHAAHLERFASAPNLADVSLQDVDGKPMTLRAFQGNIVLLNFWTTW